MQRPEANLQYFMLEGFEDHWTKADSIRTANYYNMPPGDYVFKLKVSSSYGINSNLSVRVIIHAPWWRTWWAYTLYALLLLFIILTTVRWRTRALQKEKKLLEDKVAERTGELREQKKNW